MNISKAKIIAIFIIVIYILYENIVVSNIKKLNDKYDSRRTKDEVHNLISFKDDYNVNDFAVTYINSFLKELQASPEEALIKYIDETYYNQNIKDDIQKYLTDLKSNLLILETENNNYYIKNTLSLKNSDDKDLLNYNVMVLKNGLEYPEGYNILINTNNQDKSKSMDIKILEELPYTFKIVSIDNTINEEDF